MSILTSRGPGIHFKGYENAWKLNILVQNFEISRMYSLYSAHVMSYHRCMFTEKNHLNIFGIKWDRNIIITVISNHLSHAQGSWPVYFFLLTNLKCHPNMSMWLLQQRIIMWAGWLLWCLKSIKVIIISWHMQLCQFCQLAWKNETADLCKSFNSTHSSKVFYIKLIINIINSRTFDEQSWHFSMFR